ncbi:MAG: glucokinase [Paracoccus denitrificans]|nr:MAG: glucokinase [Paracoccus denitrificans]PZO85820.1 MAG: glucokinase [Paracoccus denitrificans]
MFGIVADIGGTNTRLGVVRTGESQPTRIVRFLNESYSDFATVLSTYLDQVEQPQVTGIAVALAGPVTSGAGRLTNRDWHVTEDALAETLGAPAFLINDMTALGLALSVLEPSGFDVLRPAADGRPLNRQALVVNAGTGVNISAVRRQDQGADWVMESEAGHAALPARIADLLRDAIGPDAQQFQSLEDLFAGPGLLRLYRLRAGHDAAHLPTDADAGVTLAVDTIDLTARLFGIACADMAARHWPGDGIWLAGSAARAMGLRRKAFLDGMTAAGGRMAEPIAAMPVGIITDDYAPLRGCATLLAKKPS